MMIIPAMEFSSETTVMKATARRPRDRRRAVSATNLSLSVSDMPLPSARPAWTSMASADLQGA